MDFHFDSAEDSRGYRTHLILDPATSSIRWIQLYDGPNKVFEFPSLPTPLCTIQFVRYDLQTNQLVKRDAKGEYTVRDFINYVPQNANVSGNRLQFTNLQGQPYISTGIMPVEFSKINVEISFSAPDQSIEDPGWIDIDVALTFPSEFSNASYTEQQAWQLVLIFPNIQFDVSESSAAKADGAYIKDWSVLFPGGNLGKIAELTKSHFHGMPVQFASLYRTTASYARGVAFSATDVYGHHKSFIYSRPAFQAPPTVHGLNSYLTMPMHLNGVRYVTPNLPDEPQFHFRLSKGDKYGFGGAKMHYRIKAFHIDKTTSGSVLDWMDVANIYRKWVKARRGAWLKKTFSRTAGAPMDNMSPFTVITNYGLDGPIDPSISDPNLPSKWLEIHPIKIDGKTDMPASPTQPVNDNESLQDVLKRIRLKVNTADDAVRLEAQPWGYEPGGYYHYIGGYPTITDVLHPPTDPPRFKRAMDQLVSAKVMPVFTSDFFKQIFNGARYRGHLIWNKPNWNLPHWNEINLASAWRDAIAHQFPSAYVDPARNPNPCKFRIATKWYNDPANPNSYVDLARVFIVKKLVDPEGRNLFDPQPDCREAETLAASQLYDERGKASFLPLIGNPFYNRQGRPICATAEAIDLYLNTQLSNGAFKYGARMLEFMKAGYGGCYYKGHQHIFGDPGSPFYSNVIGLGPQATVSLQRILAEIQRRGLQADQSFVLSHEGATLEPLLPYYSEYYHSSPVYHFVYSEVISAKMPLTGVVPYIHPGYKEKRRPINGQEPTTLAPPDVMLLPTAEEQEKDPPPDLVIPPDPETMPLPNDPRTQSFNAWKQICVNYFNQYFRVENYGIAPKSYPTAPKVLGPTPVPWVPNNPLAPTDPPTYTYIRCVQDVFNLRYFIYLTAASGVVGERIFLHANWFEQPFDYNDELVKLATRIVYMQTRFFRHFQKGLMLGRTTITSGNRRLWAWRAAFRFFDDVKPLVEKVPGQQLRDFVSLGWDKEYIDKNRINAFVVKYDKIQHMVWVVGRDDARRMLYVFVNAGNAETPVRFIYSRGLEGVSNNQATYSGWEKEIIRYTDAGIKQTVAPVWLDQEETDLVMPPRTVAAIEVRKVNHAQFVTQTVPTTMKAGGEHNVSVQMKNIGTSTWSESARYRLGSQNPHDNTNWGTNRVGFGPGSVAPGQTKNFQFTVKAPTTPGSYNFQWRMLRLGVEWFGERTQNVLVNVVP
jgi:hypothetical protein